MKAWRRGCVPSRPSAAHMGQLSKATRGAWGAIISIASSSAEGPRCYMHVVWLDAGSWDRGIVCRGISAPDLLGPDTRPRTLAVGCCGGDCLQYESLRLMPTSPGFML